MSADEIPRLIVGFSGGPGAAFGVQVLRFLLPLPVETHLVVTTASELSAQDEIGLEPSRLRALSDRWYDGKNQAARISSGSFLTKGMVVVACSDRSLASIATGYADDLLHRAADVTIKEARPLTIVLHKVGASHHVRRLVEIPWVDVKCVDVGEERDPGIADALMHSILERFLPNAGLATGVPTAQ